jgi:hypothetical protein
VLRGFLPWRYQVGTGFVVDQSGNKSEQQDIILYDRQYSPALLSSDDVEQSIYVPVESVYAVGGSPLERTSGLDCTTCCDAAPPQPQAIAVGPVRWRLQYAVIEAKPVLNRQYVMMAMKKAASVRRLQRTQATVIHTAHGQQEAAPHQAILAGIVARNSEWAWGNLANTLAQALAAGADTYGPESQLTMGLALDGGSFREWPVGHLDISAQATAMISFLMELLRQLEPLGTAGRLDISAYHDALTEWGGA